MTTALALCLLLAQGAAQGGLDRGGWDSLLPVRLSGAAVTVAPGTTIAQVLVARGVTVPPGIVRSLVHHRPLASNRRPGTVLVNGRPAPDRRPLHAGDALTVVHGPDTFEPAQVVRAPVPAPNPYGLYVGGSPGVDRVVRGAISGEISSRALLTPSRLGHLRAPGAVVLTFDDGPDPTWTPMVLQLLAAAHVRATFCLIGSQAAAYPALVRAIVAGGHSLCDHSWHHDEQLRHRPPSRIRADLAVSYQAITRASGGRKPAFFRAPGGNWSPGLQAEAKRQHMTPLKWTVDPRDWSQPGVVSILRTIDRQLRPGGVVLMHDGGGDRSQTVAALTSLLAKLRIAGFTVVPATPS